MPRPEKSRAARNAEKLLRDAITTETVALQEELAAANHEIERLRGVLAKIGHIARDGAQPLPFTPAQVTNEVIAAVKANAEVLRHTQEPPIPEGPSAELSEEDGMGPGRWA